MNKCKSCGKELAYSFRFCPACGTEAYASIDPAKINARSFVDIFNSLYNILADKNNDDRRKYLPKQSEDIIIRRCKIEYEEDVASMLRSPFVKFTPNKSYDELYHLTLSNTLSGYTYRSVEELIENRKSQPLSRTDIDKLFNSLFREAAGDLANSHYRDLDRKHNLDNRVLFCLALRWNNQQIQFMLADTSLHETWWPTILSENIELSKQKHKNVSSRLSLDSIEGGAEQDLLFGYIVRLAESLNPYQ